MWSNQTIWYCCSNICGKLRLVLPIIEYSEIISETIRRAYNNTFYIPSQSIQTYSQNFSVGTVGASANFSWNITATLRNAKGMCFIFRSATTLGQQSQYSLSSRTSLGITSAQLAIGSYTFPRNRYLMYEGTNT